MFLKCLQMLSVLRRIQQQQERGLDEISVLMDGWEAARVIQVATHWKLWGFGRANKGWTTLSGLKLHRVIQALPGHLKCELLLRGRTVSF